MDGNLLNDIEKVVDADRSHVWHHLIQHKPFETGAPRIIVEGKGMRVWDQKGKEHIDAVSGGVWTVNVGYGRERIANAIRDQLIKLPYFAGSAGSIHHGAPTPRPAGPRAIVRAPGQNAPTHNSDSRRSPVRRRQ